jgi:negative regulator of sigma E activity
VNELHDTDGGIGGQKNVGQSNVDSKNMNESHTEHFLHNVSHRLDQAVETIDASTQARLRAARREALAAAESRSRPAWLMPVGSLAVAATVAVLTVSVWLVPPDTAVDAQLPTLEDIALLSDSEALEFYENLDFYLWLDEQDKAG